MYTTRITVEALDYKRYFNFHLSQTKIVQEPSSRRHQKQEKVLQEVPKHTNVKIATKKVYY